MAALITMLNRRLSMVLLVCVALPFIFVTLSRLGSSDGLAGQAQSVMESTGRSANKIKQEWSEMTFGKEGEKPAPAPVSERPQVAPAASMSERPPPLSTAQASESAALKDDIVAAARNDTLGFGAILLISLKTRTDRQDAVSLIGSSQGVRITEIIQAVRGEDISQKALPFGTARTELPLPYLGSWRSHMNAFKYIIDNRIETALLLEDDVDWDIYVKEQMTALSLALRSNPLRKPLTPDEITRAPYGLDWDVIHLGTSKNTMAPPPFNNLFYRYDDSRSTPRSLIHRTSPCGERDFFCWHDIIKQTQTADNQRVVFPSYQPVGLVALAVSFRGAQKMLYDLSWKGLDTSMDFGVRDGCQRGFLKGWSVAPPIMSSWRVKGAGDSDLRNGGKGSPGVGVGNLQGESVGLGWSSRKYMQSEFDKHNYWEDGTIGWFAQDRPPVPDNTYVSKIVETPGLAEHQKEKPVQGSEKLEEDPNKQPPHQEPQPTEKPALQREEQDVKEEPHRSQAIPNHSEEEHQETQPHRSQAIPESHNEPVRAPERKVQTPDQETPDQETPQQDPQQSQGQTQKENKDEKPNEDDAFAKR